MSCGHSPRRATLNYISSCTARAPLRFCSATPGIGCRPHSSGTTSVPDGATRRRSRFPQPEDQQQQPSTTCLSCAKPRASSNCKIERFQAASSGHQRFSASSAPPANPANDAGTLIRAKKSSPWLRAKPSGPSTARVIGTYPPVSVFLDSCGSTVRSGGSR